MRNPNNLRNNISAALIGLGLALSTTVLAQTLNYESHVLPEILVIEPLDRAALDSAVDVIVKGPSGYLQRNRFRAGRAIEISLRGLADGSYRYELQVVDKAGPLAFRDSLSQIDEATVIGAAGNFTMVNGRAADPGLVEASAGEGESGPGEASRPGAVGMDDAGFVADDDAIRAQVINQDLIVVGSQCVGMDCTSGESFGFDTIRLKENNLRIKFDDTSNSGSFPNVDWQLTANDSTNGGANKFAIEDISNARVPFTIEATAPSNALYVDDAGNVGLGTSTPVVEQHIVDGDSPTIRLDQNGSSGFTPQVWDMAGNETNFFVRDVTNGSRLPFKIRPNSPTDALVLEPAGTRLNNLTTFSANVGMGMGLTTADHPLQVRGDGSATTVRIEEVSSINLARELLLLANNGASTIQFDDTSGNLHDWQISSTRFGFFITEEDSGTTEFSLSRGTGNLTISGTLTQNSDVNRKTNITPVDPAYVLQRVSELPISTWAYKEDEQVLHLGPMAQDFFRQFGLGNSDRKIATIDTSGVALAAIQGLKQELDRKDQEISRLRTEIEQLNEVAAAQSELVRHIEALSARLTTVERVQDDAMFRPAMEQVRAEH